MCEKQFNHRALAVARGGVQRSASRRLVCIRPRGIGASIEQQPDDGLVTELDSAPQRASPVWAGLVDQAGIRVENGGHAIEVAKRGSCG